MTEPVDIPRFLWLPALILQPGDQVRSYISLCLYRIDVVSPGWILGYIFRTEEEPFCILVPPLVLRPVVDRDESVAQIQHLAPYMS